MKHQQQLLHGTIALAFLSLTLSFALMWMESVTMVARRPGALWRAHIDGVDIDIGVDVYPARQQSQGKVTLWVFAYDQHYYLLSVPALRRPFELSG